VKNVVSTYVERWNTLLGLIFVLVIMFMPYGLVPGFKQLWSRWRGGAKPRPALPSAAPAPETAVKSSAAAPETAA
jgi:branched-chain amino acid transport system permease protein